MNKHSKIYIAGHTGLVGSALVRCFRQHGFNNLVLRSHAELDLTVQSQVKQFFQTEQPEIVIDAAAKVGGIYANSHYPADFITINLAIQQNIIEACYQNQVAKLLFLGSSCIYPKLSPQPIKEGYLLTGSLEPTNRPYALAKIAGIEQCWAYNRQYGTRYLALMPTNLYGPGDNYDLQNSHVLPALMRKIHEAKQSGATTISAWGTGSARREFMFVDDLADACLFLLDRSDVDFNKLLQPEDQPPVLNIGTGEDISIKALIENLKTIIGFEGAVEWDVSMPDGTPVKRLDVARIATLGWRAKTPLNKGIEAAYQHFLQTQASLSAVGT